MKKLIVSVFALSLAACQSTQANLPPIPANKCTVGKDCDAKWSRAVAWVSQNSSYKIQLQTDSIIQTYGPSENSALVAVTVNKIIGTNGQAEIAASMGCANLIGCVPSVREQLQSFSSFVN